jgi:hypothetical protein
VLRRKICFYFLCSMYIFTMSSAITVEDISFSWVISSLDVAPSLDGLTNVVKNIHWRYRADYTDAATGKSYTCDVYGSNSLGNPVPESFVPYEQLQKDTVEGWLSHMIDVTGYKTYLCETIRQQLTPPIVTLPLPWVPVPPPPAPVVEESAPAPAPAPSSDPAPAPSSDPAPAPSSDPAPAPSSDPAPAPSSDPAPAPSSDPAPAPEPAP